MSKFEAISNAEASARAVLRKHAIDKFPVDLAALCEKERIICLKKTLDSELSGMSFIKGGQRYVIVNDRHRENRSRFTIAHEIGHHLLHSEYLSHNIHVDTVVLRRDELSAEGVDLKEVSANAFAAELLMPRNQMLRYSGLDLADQVSVEKVACNFGVSATALTYRLSNLANRS